MYIGFEKVSYEQFSKDVKESFRKEKYSDDEIKSMYDSIELPRRADEGSCGYDIRTPIGFTLRPEQNIKVPTGIRAIMPNNLFMAIFPRSGLGFKYRLQLDNTVGIVDSSYAYADNEGHIFVKVTNDSHKDQELEIKPNDRFCQGVFMSYCTTDDDHPKGKRTGGMGSTGTK